jgi:hypothetical protein
MEVIRKWVTLKSQVVTRKWAVLNMEWEDTHKWAVIHKLVSAPKRNSSNASQHIISTNSTIFTLTTYLNRWVVFVFLGNVY